jgi:hypothetical protein
MNLPAEPSTPSLDGGGSGALSDSLVIAVDQLS